MHGILLFFFLYLFGLGKMTIKVFYLFSLTRRFSQLKTIHWCQQQMLPIENISNLNVSFGE